VPLTEVDLRDTQASELSEIIKKLETLLIKISSQSPSPVSSPIDPLRSLTEIGLDSFTLIQFTGALQQRFHIWEDIL
jgi:acyl carrier protein